MNTNQRVRTDRKPVSSKSQVESPRPGERSERKQSRAEQAAMVAKTGNDRPFDEEFDHPSCLCIYDRVGRGIVSKVIGEDEFSSLSLACAVAGIKMETVIAEAVREKIQSFGLSNHRVENTENTARVISAVVSEDEVSLISNALIKRYQGMGEKWPSMSEFFKSAVLEAAKNLAADQPQSRAGQATPGSATLLDVADSLHKQFLKTRFLMESLLSVAKELAAGESLHTIDQTLDGFGFTLDDHMDSMKSALAGLEPFYKRPPAATGNA